jgi:Sigma-70 region 2
MMRRSDPLAQPEPLIRRVYAYAAYRLGDGQDAEDVTSETFARALRYETILPRLRFDSDDLRCEVPQGLALGDQRSSSSPRRCRVS